MKDDDIVKLFYQNSSKYNGNVENWGNCKGSTYNNVCVVLNKKTYNLYKKNELKLLAMSTRNKLYVACTRTKNNLFFVDESKLNKYKKGGINILNNTETNRIENKEQLNEDFEQEVIAFLNYREGGTIYIGIKKDGQVVGIDNVDTIQLQIKDRIKNNIGHLL